MYHYGEAGRLESVILPTGETMSLSSHLTEDDSLAVQVSAPVQSLSVVVPELPAVTTLKMKGRGAHRLTIKEGLHSFISCLLWYEIRGSGDKIFPFQWLLAYGFCVTVRTLIISFFPLYYERCTDT
jgi:hypothetical protein